MEFQVRYLALFLLFSVKDSFDWFWMGSLHKNIQLMLEFLKGLFLVLHFSYYTLMTSLMLLSVILLSMLMILRSTVSVIRRLNLIYETLWTGAGSGLLILLLEKLCCFYLTGLITVVLIDVKMDRSVLKSSFKLLGLPFYSKLD